MRRTRPPNGSFVASGLRALSGWVLGLQALFAGIVFVTSFVLPDPA